MIRNYITKYADYLGIGSSIICLVHCLAVPAMALASSTYLEFGHVGTDVSEWTALILSLVAVWQASKRSPFASVRKLLWVFLALFITCTLLSHWSLELAWLKVVAYLGSFGLIAAHIINIRKSRDCATTGCIVPHA
jgi:hypothetical protein